MIDSVKNPSQPGIKHRSKTRWIFWKQIWSKQCCFDNCFCKKRVCHVNPLDLWPEHCLGSTPESGLQTMIIIIFIYILTLPTRALGLVYVDYKLGFKTIIIKTFILTLNWIDPPDLWPKPYLGLTLELNFKTIIIIIFILCWPGSTWLCSDRLSS